MKIVRAVLFGGVLAGGVAAAGAALADEVIIHREAPVEVVPVAPAPDAVVIGRRSRDCATTTTRRENGLGDSETVTRRNCD